MVQGLGSVRVQSLGLRVAHGFRLWGHRFSAFRVSCSGRILFGFDV